MPADKKNIYLVYHVRIVHQVYEYSVYDEQMLIVRVLVCPRMFFIPKCALTAI